MCLSLPDESASTLLTTALDEWFIAHVLPLEGLIHAFLRRHGHEDSEILIFGRRLTHAYTKRRVGVCRRRPNLLS
jgi:hypothetical protein